MPKIDLFTSILMSAVILLAFALGIEVRANNDLQQKLDTEHYLHETTHTDLQVCWQTYNDCKK
jgi:hypothetical protein